jgi:glycosyltransferase involved in cell wall biosynthesis
MRVCMVLGYTYPPDVRVRKEAKALRAAGHEVTLLCRGRDDDPERASLDGMDVVRLKEDTPMRKLGRLGSAVVNLATNRHPLWARRLDRLVDECDADAIHVHDLPLVQTALSVGRDRDLPVVADLHENYPAALRQWRSVDDWRSLCRHPKRLLMRCCYPVSRYDRIERRATRAVDHLFAPVQEAVTHYRRDCEVAEADATVVSNTVDLDVFDGDAAPESIDHDGFVAGYVGTFGPHRGLETAVRATARLTSADAGLLLVGSGSDTYERRLDSVVEAAGVTDRVLRTGWVDDATFPAYMSACDVCLVPHARTTHTETTVPHKLFQYMATGTPVVVTDLDPLARVVEDADAGVVVPPEDPAAMADALADLASDPERRRQLGANGRRAVEETYNWERDGRRLVETYERLVDA